jgi:hypothetical protein
MGNGQFSPSGSVSNFPPDPQTFPICPLRRSQSLHFPISPLFRPQLVNVQHTTYRTSLSMVYHSSCGSVSTQHIHRRTAVPVPSGVQLYHYRTVLLLFSRSSRCREISTGKALLQARRNFSQVNGSNSEPCKLLCDECAGPTSGALVRPVSGVL